MIRRPRKDEWEDEFGVTRRSTGLPNPQPHSCMRCRNLNTIGLCEKENRVGNSDLTNACAKFDEAKGRDLV